MLKTISLSPGSNVQYKGRNYVIASGLDLNSVLAKDAITGEAKILLVNELYPAEIASDDKLLSEIDLANEPEEDWNIANKRYSAIKPLLKNKRSVSEVEEVADAHQIDKATVYRWLQAYENMGKLSSLLPSKRGRKKKKGLLDSELEIIITFCLEEYYLNKQRPSVRKTYDEVVKRCKFAGLEPPHSNTVRKRIQWISEREKIKRRVSRDAAKEKFDPHVGSFNDANFPLSIVQIDHTPVDLILVDDVDRQPIGRPWITVAIDVFSRMIAGFYISLDPPSAMSVGLCLSRAILPKTEFLAKQKIDVDWPIWGMMQIVHADNAKEFRGAMLQRACEEYHIDLHWRPVGRAHFGGHIERLLGTFNGEIHNLPGTTFSSVEQRKGYNSDKESAFTLDEFERWLTTYITKVYHQKYHTGIDNTPIKKYEEGIFGTDDQPGRGLPELIIDKEKLKLDLMPFLERTVQPYGIRIDEINYYHDVLRPWVNSKSESGRGKRKFLIRRDPRDISVIHFFDPELKQYFSIPYRDRSHPPISHWELRIVRSKLKKDGIENVDERMIFEAFDEMKRLELAAKSKTKKVRRNEQRKRSYQEKYTPVNANTAPKINDDLVDDISPYDDIEVPLNE